MTCEQEWPELIGAKFREVDAAGHKFGPDLICDNPGCEQTWEQHQWWPVPCMGKLRSPVAKMNSRTQSPLSIVCQKYGLYQREIAEQLHIGSYTIYCAFRGGKYIGQGRGKVSKETRRRVLRYAVSALLAKGVDVKAEVTEVRRCSTG